MFKNRFLIVLGVLSLLLVAMVISFPLSNTPTSAERGQAAEAKRWTAMREYYLNQSRREYLLDSATRSYIAWGKALQAAGELDDSNACSNTTQEHIFAEIPNNLDSGTRSYVVWAKAVEAESYAVDSATQSYIAQAKAIEAEKYAIDSATRSYIAWGKAVEAQRLAC